MREKKDILEQIIVEDLEEEAAKIRETIADMDPETLSPEKKAEIKDKVYERINDYDVARVMEQLPEKYQKAMKKGLEALDSSEEAAIIEEEESAEERATGGTGEGTAVTGAAVGGAASIVSCGEDRERIRVVESAGDAGDSRITESVGDGGDDRCLEYASDGGNGQSGENVGNAGNGRIAERAGDAGNDRSVESVEDAEETGTTSGIDGGHAEAKKKKNTGRKKRIRAYVAAAAVLVLVATFGINSFGGRENVMRAMRKIVGGREVSQVDSDKGNLVIEVEEEEEAYQKIKEAFGITPVRMSVRPTDMGFVSADIEEEAQIAELLYKCDSGNVIYMINMAYSKDSFGMDIEDEAADEYNLEVRGVKIHMKEYQVADAKNKKYSADFEYKKAKYFLVGTMKKDDFELIVKNFYFSL